MPRLVDFFVTGLTNGGQGVELAQPRDTLMS